MHFPRSSGVLLHPTSLPGPFGCGDLGASAYHFVDWLADAGQSLWQMLPLGPIGPGNSPYMSASAFAGNPVLVDLQDLVTHGWLLSEECQADGGLAGRTDYARVVPHRMRCLERAAARFFGSEGSEAHHAFHAFVLEHADWLEDYALFMALATRPGAGTWDAWSPRLARREPAALAKARTALQGELAFWRFIQWCFFRQWGALRRYAHERGIRIIGDIPIFIAHHSAEVWARQDLFSLGPDLRPTVVAGVPPDFFSATGQRWGNPLYRWEVLEREDYAWWVHRVRRTMDLVDIVRIDHFRGFAGYWEIPATEETAINGRWLPGPGAALFDAIQRALGELPIIAEDLGVITDDVVALRERFDLPGMRVLQFAFGGDPAHPFLPHNYVRNTAVYTGTHDNDTSVGWFEHAGESERAWAATYLGTDGQDIAQRMIRAAMGSVADLALFPMQDVLALPGTARMNLPGKSEGYWEWRFTWEQVLPEHAAGLRALAAVYGRNVR